MGKMAWGFEAAHFLAMEVAVNSCSKCKKVDITIIIVKKIFVHIGIHSAIGLLRNWAFRFEICDYFMAARVSIYSVDLASTDKDRPVTCAVRIPTVCEEPRWIQP